jgi:CelD/BcsL family acetyltransferase involved in cellulose biosynthesis
MPIEPLSDEQIAFEIVRDSDGMHALREDWQRLWQASASDFYLLGFPALWRTWKQVLEPRGDTLHIVVGRLAGRVVLIWPTVVRRKRYYGIWREARWLGRDPIDYSEVLIELSAERDVWIKAALDHLIATAKVDFLYFESVRADALVHPVLARANALEEPDAPAPFADLRQYSDGSELEKRMGKRFRGSMNRRLRRLEEVGPVTFEHDPAPEGLDETVHWMNERKREWMDERGFVVGHGIEEEHGTSLIDIIRDGAAAGHTLVSRLSVNGQLIAASVNFLSNRRMYYDYGSFDLRWAKYSPGSLLLRETIRWAVDNGVETIDLARGTDHYKLKWSDGEVPVSDYMIARTALGRLLGIVRESKTLRSYISWTKARLKGQGSAGQSEQAQE